MADSDPRRIPQVSADSAGNVTAQGINEVIRQVVEMIYQLEGRRGEINLRDKVIVDAPAKNTLLELKGASSDLNVSVAETSTYFAKGALRNDYGSWMATDIVAVILEMPESATLNIYINTNLAVGSIFTPTLAGTLTPTPAALGHNDLSGLQGGSASERYHLTLAEKNFHGVSVYHSGGDASYQIIPQGSSLTLAYDLEEYDTDGFHDNVTNNSRLTVPAGLDGYYVFGGSYYLATTAAMTYMATAVYKNGSTLIHEDYRYATTVCLHTFSSRPYHFVAGDYITHAVFTGGTGWAYWYNFAEYSNYFWMRRVGV